jgi:acetyl-CoA carboxylase biotin carboxyl carrier protein
MPTHCLVAHVEVEADKSYVIYSPAVGIADGVPAKGVYLNPTGICFTLRVLNHRLLIQLPRQVQGRVVEQYIEDTQTPVAYHQRLFKLSARSEALDALGRVALEGQTEGGAAAVAAAEEDLIAVRAPSEGVFYRRPSPESPPYVEEGSPVTQGTMLGLVEVMKSFNHITYGGPTLPPHGIVAQILVQDTTEVAFGQTLFLIRPA